MSKSIEHVSALIESAAKKILNDHDLDHLVVASIGYEEFSVHGEEDAVKDAIVNAYCKDPVTKQWYPC